MFVSKLHYSTPLVKVCCADIVIYLSFCYLVHLKTTFQVSFDKLCLILRPLIQSGERRIRVHTLAVPVAKTLSEVHAHADQQAIIGLLAKMGR